MRNRILVSGLTLLALFAAPLAQADELEALEKKITDAWSKIQSMTAKMEMKSEMGNEQFKMSMHSEGTIEMLRKGDKLLYHMEMKSASTQNVGGQETKNDATTQMVSDGEFQWMYSEQGGQKMAMKNKADSSQMEPKKMIADLKESATVKILTDEKVGEFDCWVLEVTPKAQEGAEPQGTMVYYFAKEIGNAVKMIGKDKDGKETQSMIYSDIKVNPSIAPDRFVFKAPEGVEVQDMTKAGGNGMETP